MIDISSSSGGNAIHASTPRCSQHVHAAAEVGGQDPDRGGEHAADAHGAEAHVERDAGAVEEAGQQIAAELVGAEPVRARSWR